MNSYTCKCGKKTYWESGMPPRDCQGCEECNTNFKKKPLVPHDFSKIEYNGKTGKPYKLCINCYTVDEKSYKESKIIDNNKKN